LRSFGHPKEENFLRTPMSKGHHLILISPRGKASENSVEQATSRSSQSGTITSRSGKSLQRQLARGIPSKINQSGKNPLKVSYQGRPPQKHEKVKTLQEMDE